MTIYFLLRHFGTTNTELEIEREGGKWSCCNGKKKIEHGNNKKISLKRAKDWKWKIIHSIFFCSSYASQRVFAWYFIRSVSSYIYILYIHGICCCVCISFRIFQLCSLRAQKKCERLLLDWTDCIRAQLWELEVARALSFALSFYRRIFRIKLNRTKSEKNKMKEEKLWDCILVLCDFRSGLYFLYLPAFWSSNNSLLHAVEIAWQKEYKKNNHLNTDFQVLFIRCASSSQLILFQTRFSSRIFASRKIKNFQLFHIESVVLVFCSIVCAWSFFFSSQST